MTDPIFCCFDHFCCQPLLVIPMHNRSSPPQSTWVQWPVPRAAKPYHVGGTCALAPPAIAGFQCLPSEDAVALPDAKGRELARGTGGWIRQRHVPVAAGARLRVGAPVPRVVGRGCYRHPAAHRRGGGRAGVQVRAGCWRTEPVPAAHGPVSPSRQIDPDPTRGQLPRQAGAAARGCAAVRTRRTRSSDASAADRCAPHRPRSRETCPPHLAIFCFGRRARVSQVQHEQGGA